jgi:signal transduction histidine kinase
MQLSLNQKIRIGFAASILLMIFISFFSIGSIFSLNEKEKNVSHTFLVLIKLEEVFSLLKDAETNTRGYVLTKNPEFLTAYETSLKNVDPRLDELRKLITDNPTQMEHFKNLRILIDKRLQVIKVFLYYHETGQLEIAQTITQKGKGPQLMDRIGSTISTMKTTENQLLSQRQELSKSSTIYTYLIISLGNILAISAILAAIYFINIDITKRKEAEVALTSRQKELEQLNKELEAFSYTISHDLRSPLRAIDGFGKILKDEYASILDEEGNRLLGVIQGNAVKMGNLIDDLLNFSRLMRKELIKTTYSMQELVKDIVQDVRSSNPQWNPEVHVKEIGDAPSDPSLMHQVWINLISNSFKYSSRKTTSKIEIGCIVKENEIEYYIEDNGVGFDMQYKNKLFGIFQRLHSHKEFEGTGVGLAIVHRIVNRHHGTVSAFGIVGAGARFAFTLPMEPLETQIK